MGAFEIPKPGPEHEVLARMAGAWTCEETMHPSAWSPQATTADGRCTTRMLDGFFAITDYEQLKEGEVTFRGHGVYGWDPAAREYVMYWVDSMGGAGGVARGTYEDGVLTFRNRSPMGHNRYRYTFGDDATHFQIATSKDGESWTRATRRAPTPRGVHPGPGASRATASRSPTSRSWCARPATRRPLPPCTRPARARTR